MRRIALVAAALLAPLGAAPLSQGERDFAMSDLHASRKLFLDAIAGLSEAQWKFKPAPDRWSIAEVAEHVAKTEDSLFQNIIEKVVKGEPDKDQKPVSREQDQQLIDRIRDRSKKAKASEADSPSGKWATREAMIEDFKKSRDRTIEYAETTRDDLRAHSTRGMDGYQWILLIGAHTERHTAQINEVKANAGYPKK